MDSSAIVAIVVAVISACVGPICLALVKHLLDKKDRREAEQAAKAEKERAAWQNEVKGMINPVAAEVSQIKTNQAQLQEKIEKIDKMLEEDKQATVLSLRCEMRRIHEEKMSGKDLDNNDLILFVELYKRYHHMGGNHYREAVDRWGKDLGFKAEELKEFKDHDDEI